MNYPKKCVVKLVLTNQSFFNLKKHKDRGVVKFADNIITDFNRDKKRSAMN